jgi:hypothetical protein
MLSPLDDYPVHQISEVIRHVGTSDRNFYDRYYFNLYNKAGDLFSVFGFGQYPNLGTADVFLSVSHQEVHRVARASKELGTNRMDTTIGPLRVEVIEPLHKLRVVCEPGEAATAAGLEIDATFEGSMEPYLEPRHWRREFERVTFDTQRLAQTGRWSGHLKVGDKTIDMGQEEFWGYRDRSWGVRPVGDPEPPGIRASQAPGGFFWLYAPLQFDDHSYLIIAQELQDGSRLLEDAVRVWHDGRVEPLGRPEYEIEFVPGTRAPKRVTLHMHEPNGQPLDISLDIVMPFYLPMGSGYGSEPDWRHGMWQGPLKSQGLQWDLNASETRKKLIGFAEYSARAETSTGAQGYGMFEFALVGPHDPTGFAGWEDMTLVAP